MFTKYGLIKPDSFWMYLAASSVSGVVVCAAMQPADTVLTRMYNQNTVTDPVTGKVRGALYTNPIDCLWKTAKTEGIKGWYKGESPSGASRSGAERARRITERERSLLTCRNHGPFPPYRAAHGHHPRRQRAHWQGVQEAHWPRISC